ncbi:MAG: polynucleotide kinase [Longispora sp.]|nr:polynucleotide kinase [Longispora sp. (in: high G+C Gram-positive bacteria)]
MPQPRAIVFDVDGTLALRGDHANVRRWYDWHRVGEDSPNEAVVELAQTIARAGLHRIIVMSGRDEVCRAETEQWLREQNVPFDELYMRPAGDGRKDSIVKEELYLKYVEPRYHVPFVVDDRDQVVDMWRTRFGLVCMQVAPGDF